MNRPHRLLFVGLILFALLATSVAANDRGSSQSYDCVLNILHTQRHWISPLAKSPAEPETWFKPERLVTHVTVEILSAKPRLGGSLPPEPASFARFMKNNARQLLIEVSTAVGRELTPYVARNGSVPAPLKVKGVITLSTYTDIPGIDPNKIHVNLVVTKILSGTPVK
jgi:hypothetical protein